LGRKFYSPFDELFSYFWLKSRKFKKGETMNKVWKFGDNIDTDIIIAARYLNTSDENILAKHIMEDADPNFSTKIDKGDIIVAGENFGCGSSREHAPIALKAAGIGAVIAIVLTLCRVPALAFALGMFIPMSLDVPLLIGGLVAWYVSTRSKDKAVNTARSEKGTLVASGFIAGGALMGVVSAIIKFGGLDLTIPHWNTSAGGQWLSLVAYGALIGFFIWFVLRNKKEKQ